MFVEEKYVRLLVTHIECKLLPDIEHFMSIVNVNSLQQNEDYTCIINVYVGVLFNEIKMIVDILSF